MSFKTSPMTGFELQASGVGSDHSANRATTKKCTQLNFIFIFFRGDVTQTATADEKLL